MGGRLGPSVSGVLIVGLALTGCGRVGFELQPQHETDRGLDAATETGPRSDSAHPDAVPHVDGAMDSSFFGMDAHMREGGRMDAAADGGGRMDADREAGQQMEAGSDSGSSNGGMDAGSSDGGTDSGSSGGGMDAGGSDGGMDAGGSDSGSSGGGMDAGGSDGGMDAGGSDSGSSGGGMDAGGSDGGMDAGGTDSGTDGGSSCTTASSTCWDIWAVHTKTKYERVANHIFEQQVSDGEKIYGLFDGTTDTPRPPDDTSCPPYYTSQDRPEGWEVWRTQVDADTYRVQVYGKSEADCELGQPVAAGEIQIATDEWSISSVQECHYKQDTKSSNDTKIDTWCTVDMATGNVTWQSGSGCDPCCSCPDGATVRIEFTVVRQ